MHCMSLLLLLACYLMPLNPTKKRAVIIILNFSSDGIPGVLGSIVSSFTFKQYVVNPTHKLVVFASFNLVREIQIIF